VKSADQKPSGPAAPLPLYALVTPARNEAKLIEQTLEAVVQQTLKPARWVIVSDGSTDGTDAIVLRYATQHAWIELLRLPEDRERSFAAKVGAFKAGYARLASISCEVIGNLDADITFEPGYFEFLMQHFAEDSDLGVAGTPIREGNATYDYRFTSIEHVSGACQLFRRVCFEAIGGSPAVAGGGVDLIAVTTARMKGWKTRTFTEMVSTHHRRMGTGSTRSRLKAMYRDGRKDYFLGSHPLWEIFRCVYQMARQPYLIRGVCLLAGYIRETVSQAPRPVSAEFVAFRRAEQMRRLKAYLTRGRQGAHDAHHQC
jgi:poly-beta-1,6-N-acetyl-D-glucosamine synthase